MAKVTNPLLSSEAKGRIGHLVVYYGKGKARGWSTQRDPKTAGQLQSRAVVGEVMAMIKQCDGLDRAWLRQNYARSWHTRFTAWVSRNALQNAKAVHADWSTMSAGERATWEAIAPG
jgi:hypothetical protein